MDQGNIQHIRIQVSHFRSFHPSSYPENFASDLQKTEEFWEENSKKEPFVKENT